MTSLGNNLNIPESDDTTCIQWNCQGLRNKKDELSEIIQTNKPAIIALQETKFKNETIFNIPNYSCIRKEGHFNHTAHGGVALFIHESVPYVEITLTTDLQAVAATVHIKQKITVCSIYISHNHMFNQAVITDLTNQLQKPFIMMGDFNGHNELWGSSRNDARGNMIETYINRNGLIILNDGSPTRIAYNAETAIDLSICSPVLAPIIQWSVDSSPGDSDHCPIKLKMITNERNTLEGKEKLNLKKINWEKFHESNAWNDLPDNLERYNTHLIQDFYRRFEVAINESAPKYIMTKFFPKPWWSDELKKTKNEREKNYQRYRRNKTLENLLNWKKSRALHKTKIVQHKRDSWKNLASTFNENTPSAVIYENIRKIKGRTQRNINILKENQQTFSSTEDIAKKFSDHFYNVSSNNNYSNYFKNIKTFEEQREMNFQSDNSEVYNSAFNMNEFEYSINKNRNSAIGPDNISYEMIQHLPIHAKQYCLKMFNKFWSDSFFPSKWKESTIIPILKPNKDASKTENYRPISLTSNLCKTFERIVNNRLTTYLEMNGSIDKIQCGSMKNRSTEDHLVRLETTIRKAFANSQHHVSIFFDIEKAYDTTWRHGIMKDMHNMGLRGRLPLFIKEFMTDRVFKVKIGESISVGRILETGIPQGSVLSPTLFIIKINSLTKVIPKEVGFHASLYVDDLQIGYQHADLNQIKEKIQPTINSIIKWGDNNGFKFSSSKTKAVHFTIDPRLICSPALQLNQENLQYSDSTKFLGLIWDKKLNWKAHLSTLKIKCTKLLGMLRSITSQEWGADQATTMMLYRSLIRSRLDYGSVIYNSANDTDLQVLNTIANDAMRMATGAFKSTPVSSLEILTNEMPLKMRRETLTLKYFFKTKSHLSNPAFNQAIPFSQELFRIFKNKHLKLPFPYRVHVLLEELQISRNLIKPNFNHRILHFEQPDYSLKKPEIILELNESSKEMTTDIEYKQMFGNLVETKFLNSMHIYTDGSKTDQGVGAAAVTESIIKIATLPKEASIYSAELHAIHLALLIIIESQNTNFTIFSDSLSSLMKIGHFKTKHPTVSFINHKIDEMMRSGKNINLCWIPGHVGIKGNEIADTNAKRAGTRGVEAISIHYKDMFPVIAEKIKVKWNLVWQNSRNKLLSIKREAGEWNKERMRMNRKEEVILNRIRLGHTYLTHSYLMEGGVATMAPVCNFCGNSILTIEHIFQSCPRLEQERRIFITACRINPEPNLESLLGERSKYKEIFNFLRYIGIIDVI